MYLGQVEITEHNGKTHYLGNIKINNLTGSGGRGFLISGGTLPAGEKPSNAIVTYDEAREEAKRLARLAKTTTGTEQWTLEISDPSGQYITHRKYLRKRRRESSWFRGHASKRHNIRQDAG
jgi:hypothetical protein